jgi:hypothetical protein
MCGLKWRVLFGAGALKTLFQEAGGMLPAPAAGATPCAGIMPPA